MLLTICFFDTLKGDPSLSRRRYHPSRLLPSLLVRNKDRLGRAEDHDLNVPLPRPVRRRLYLCTL